jgi:hypothetical protein
MTDNPTRHEVWQRRVAARIGSVEDARRLARRRLPRPVASAAAPTS